MTFHTDHLVKVMPVLLRATLVNAWLSAVIFALAIIGGTLLTVLRTMKIRPVNLGLAGLISFIRGTPVLIQIFIFYYVLPAFGLDLSPEGAGIAALALNSSMFITEILRGGLETIDPGQVEAGASLSLPRFAIWWRVILPQIFDRVIPVLVSEATIVVKGTALLSVITVVDVLRTAQQIASSSYRPFETLLGAAICFVALNAAVMICGTALEIRGRRARA